MQNESKLDLKAIEINKNIVAKQYWQNRMSEFELHTYFETTIITESSGMETSNNHTFIAPQLVYKKLDRLANSDKAKHIVLLSTLGILAHKYSSLSDIGILSPNYLKKNGETSEEKLILARMNNFSKLTFPAFLGQFKSALLSDLKYGNYPLEKILGHKRSKFSQRSFIGMLVEELQNSSAFDELFPDLLFSFQIKESLNLKISFHSDKFQLKYIERLGSYYFELLSNLLSDRENEINKIDFISKKEKEQLLFGFNNTRSIYPKNSTVLDMFLDCVSMNPDAIAVYFENQKLSYEELNNRANQMANFILDQGISKNNIVGLLVEKSIESIVGLLAIFKANCSYLPLDPNQPIDRTLDIVKNLDLKLLLTEKDKLTHYKKYVPVVNISSPEIKTMFSTEINDNLSSNDLAYIIFTSGSTGKPKGVKIKHQSLTNLICSQTKTFEIKKEDRIFQFSSMVFDASLEQIWLAMANGAALVLASNAVILNSLKFNACLEKYEVTHLDVTPTFLNSINLANHKHLKRIIVGGEICGIDILKKYNDSFNIYNAYGPTECTVTSTICKLNKEMIKLNKIPIGRPIGNTRVYILDKNKNLSPIGVSGELYIGGDGLALGYLNDEKLTNEKFIISPFSKNEKLYITGDLARWLPDGNIDFLGRKDKQVKIRGYRIELGEIQYHLSNNEMIKESAIVVKGINNNKFLVGFYVADEELEDTKLKKYLFQKLPNYMVPSYLVQLKKMPLTPNGKLDMKALPDPRKIKKGEFIKPVNDTQKELVKIWSQVLGIEESQIGIHMNFFEIGGNSIKLISLLNFLNSKFNTQLEVARLFELSSIALLANYFNNDNKINRDEEESNFDKEISQRRATLSLFNKTKK